MRPIWPERLAYDVTRMYIRRDSAAAADVV